MSNIRKELNGKEAEFEKILEKKDNEITILKSKISEFKRGIYSIDEVI